MGIDIKRKTASRDEPGRRFSTPLLPKLKFINDLSVPLDFILFEVVQECPPLPNEIQKPMSG